MLDPRSIALQGLVGPLSVLAIATQGFLGGVTPTPPQPGAPGLQGWPVRIPQPSHKRRRRVREHSDIFALFHP